MTEETVEVTIRTTPKGFQELMANVPGLAGALRDPSAVHAEPLLPSNMEADEPGEIEGKESQ